MKTAFDFDGTITAHPERMQKLAIAFQLAGFEVIVLTAAAGELPPVDRPAEVTKRLQKYGFSAYDTLACVEGRDKGKWCEANGVDLIIDDDPKFMERIAADSPQTLRLQVLK